MCICICVCKSSLLLFSRGQNYTFINLQNESLFYLMKPLEHIDFPYLRLLDVKHMVSVTYFFRENPLPDRLLFPVSSKVSFICTFPETGQHIPQPLINQFWNPGWNGK